MIQEQKGSSQDQIPNDTRRTNADDPTRALRRDPSPVDPVQKNKRQILTILIMLVQLSIHCVFMIRPILGIDHPLLYFLWAVMWLALGFMIFDYFLLTCGDPVDKLIQVPGDVEMWKMKEMEFQRKYMGRNGTQEREDSGKEDKKNPFQMKDCKPCNRPVKILSYHCWTCKRCVEDMDHHCKYLNNCIGSRNYNQFFRLLSLTSLYLCCSIAIGIWIFRVGFLDSRVDQLAFTKWMGLVYAIFSLFCLIVVLLLLGFHCYISCYLRMTTIQYIFRDTSSNNQTGSSEESVKSMKQIK